MVKKIVKDEIFLAQKSELATKADAAVVTDLIDTLRANEKHCVGMAANMIGIRKRIIVFSIDNYINLPPVLDTIFLYGSMA